MNHLRLQWRLARKEYKTKDGRDIYIVEPRDDMLQALVAVPGEGAITAGYYQWEIKNNRWIEYPATEEDVRNHFAKEVGEPVGDWEFGTRSWYVKVKMLEVYKRFQRQGVATALLDAFKEKFRGQYIDWGSYTSQGAAFWEAVTGERPTGPRTSVDPSSRRPAW